MKNLIVKYVYEIQSKAIFKFTIEPITISAFIIDSIFLFNYDSMGIYSLRKDTYYNIIWDEVITIPSPSSSKLGLPDLPNIYKISYIFKSVHWLNSGEYTCVFLMMTVLAGKLTPQANVAVETMIRTIFYEKRSSTINLSSLHKPAWWKTSPYPKTSFKNSSLIFSLTLIIISDYSLFGFSKRDSEESAYNLS